MTPQQIEALKLALEALEEAWYHVGTFQPTEKAIDLYDEARAAIKEALAEHAMREVQRLGQEIEQEQNFCPRCGKRTKDIHTCTPPQRTWVGLTDDEIDDIYFQHQNRVEHQVAIWPYERAIEQALKEKNT